MRRVYADYAFVMTSFAINELSERKQALETAFGRGKISTGMPGDVSLTRRLWGERQHSCPRPPSEVGVCTPTDATSSHIYAFPALFPQKAQRNS
jgi:hypothetical protein